VDPRDDFVLGFRRSVLCCRMSGAGCRVPVFSCLISGATLALQGKRAGRSVTRV